MLVVHFELWPNGYEFRKRNLGTVRIVNTGEGGPAAGDYAATLSVRGHPDQIWKNIYLADFPRKRLGAYDLLYRVLRLAVGFRNQDNRT